MRQSLFALAILLSFAATAAADKPDATLLGSMQPPANAVGFPAEVIYNRGHLEFDQEFIVIRVERRLKIYSSEGFGYGQVRIPYQGTEEIAGVHAKTWLPSGKDVKAKEIHDVTVAEDKGSQRSFSVKEKVVAFPELAPGVVLDLSYDHRIKNLIFLPAWEFQGDLPIRESSFTATLPEGVVYTVDKVNPGRIEIEEQESRSIQSKTFEGKWTARQVPAIVEEPYSPSLEALTARLYFTLKSVGGPGGVYEIWRGWGDLDKIMVSLVEEYGKDTAGLERVLAADHSDRSVEERIVTLRNRVAQLVTPTGGRGIISGRAIAEILKSGVGDNPDRTYVLQAALTKAGIEAWPAWCSARDRVTPIQKPLIGQFTDVVIWVPSLKGGGGFVHTFDGWSPFQLPPPLEETLVFISNGKGGEAGETPGSPPDAHTMTCKGDFQLDGQGALTGKIEIAVTGAQAASLVHGLDHGDTAGLVERLRKKLNAPFESASLTSVQLGPSAGSKGGLTLTADVSVPSYGSATGDVLVVPAPFVTSVGVDLDPAKERVWPVYFACRVRQRETASLKLPAGWRAGASPPRASSATAFGSFDASIESAPGEIRTRRSFELAERFVEKESYNQIGDLLHGAGKASQAEIVLERAPAASSGK